MTLPDWATKRRKAIGEPKRVMQRNEEASYKTLEDLWRLHRLDFWHCTVAQRSQPGWPDYVIFGRGWLAFVEVKARQANGRMGRLSAAQERYRASVIAANGLYLLVEMPDGLQEHGAWLTDRTDIEAKVW